MEFQVVSFWLLVVGVGSLILYLTWLIPNLKTSRPPGPRNWPIVGALFYLSKSPHVAFANLAKKYGPMMYMRLGSVHHLIISNGEMAMEVLKVHDAEFASRPIVIAGKYLGLNWSTITFSHYGDHWRLLRKIAATQLLSGARINSFEPLRQEDLGCMVESIAKHSKGGKLVNVRQICHELTTNNLCRMLFGTRCETSKEFIGTNFDDFFKSVEKMIQLMSTFNLSDLIPLLRPFDLQGVEKQMKNAFDKMENQVASILKEYKKGNKMVVNSNVKDFVEILLSLDEKLDDTTIKSLIVDMFGGADTIAIGLEWALAEVIHHLEIMKRAQEELDRVVGRNRRVHESDLPNLPYLHAIIQETFRLHPPGPMTLGHVNVKNAQILQYQIPANTTVVVNIWAIGRDPKVWNKPLEFIPDRFFNTNISLTGSNYNLLPFGSGRRRCPGLELGQLMMHYGLTTLLQAFDWSPQVGVKPEDLNMEEFYRGFCEKADPLTVVAKPRLPLQFYKH
ncbi:unnamed protein product [Sphagnum jensenii]|uniref:Cytochrome P450 n=1 Tax=Sphagnum jensenii TaxID=128206 RepID=A0ABP0W0N1_9BRYO